MDMAEQGNEATIRRTGESEERDDSGRERRARRERHEGDESRRNELGFGWWGGGRGGWLIYRSPADAPEPCLSRAARWNGPCPSRHYGPTPRPRHGHGTGPGQARARLGQARAGLFRAGLVPARFNRPVWKSLSIMKCDSLPQYISGL